MATSWPAATSRLIAPGSTATKRCSLGQPGPQAMDAQFEVEKEIRRIQDGEVEYAAAARRALDDYRHKLLSAFQ